ncbi:MAG TPA: DUF4331 family protein [Methylomirabilota bacterium]|nr:DUF4331 family protein [Methylomirabilota bacterium]
MIRSASRRTGLLSLVSLALLILGVALPWGGDVRGADHREAPLINQDPAADFADVFAFLNPNDPSKIVFALTVNPFSVPGVRASYSFDPDVLYQIKIDNTGDGREDLVIQVRFAGFESARDPRCPAPGGGQFVTVLGPARPKRTGTVNGELGNRTPELTGCTNQIISGPGGIRAFAGLRDDPFVTDPAQLNRILGGVEQVFRQVDSLLGPLDGRPVVNGRSGFDTFGGFNVSALVVEVPKAEIQGARTRTGTYLANDTTIGFWGTTSRRKNFHRSNHDDDDDHGSGPFIQIQRMGQTLIKTVFIPATQRDRYNRSAPEDDLADLRNLSVSADARGFSRFIPDALTTNDNDGTGNTIAARAGLLTALGVATLPGGAPLLPGLDQLPNTDRHLIRRVIFPDVLRIDLSILPPNDLVVAANGLQNGRRLDDDVTDILLRLARQLADVKFPDGSGVPGSGPLGTRGALDCSVLPNCPDRRVLAVLQGTDFIEPDGDVEALANSGQDRPLLVDFPFFAEAHPLPGNPTPAPGTVGYPTSPGNDPT